MQEQLDANKVISDLASKIGTLEAENSILKAQLDVQESGDKQDEQHTQD